MTMGKTFFGCTFLFVSLLAVGCGGSSNDDDENGSGAIPIESFPARLAATACKSLYQCCSDAQRAENIFSGNTEAECRANYSALFTLGMPEWNQSIGKGRLRYDGNAASVCLSRLDSAGCTESVDAACDGIFVPLVRSGGACTQQGECIDSACLGGDSTNDVDGECGPPLANGADCTDDAECTSNYCDGLACASRSVNGAACLSDAECESEYCEADGFCGEPSNSVCE
jgi:hypothetical protein